MKDETNTGNDCVKSGYRYPGSGDPEGRSTAGWCVDPEYVDAMIERDNDVSTYMGNFIAIPHGTDEAKRYIKKTGISVVQVPMGVNFSSNDQEDNLVTVVFGIAGKNDEHLQLLSQIALFCSDVTNVARLADATKADDIIALLKEVGK